jgi:GTPase SAR1 family protein
MTYKDKIIPNYGPISPFDEFKIKTRLKNKDYLINIVDISGFEDFKPIRVLAYKNTDAILLCYDLCVEKEIN